ncbi:short-chain dehydrogenases/reductase, putative [Talaromyces stipitatus ATCC 10500]|uniref:Short-chain dehydrogenases/reductase, putative n=1 Tax=Talaromyces stipitatus (strain ATCC 10500 / CBS 375.48 / QM 6759 / NRRL 1006) TaxID=441959 RepID=B8M387_TALSN|nr:short-chain dehydrogenases/reductase, putative [Talaromyces stipitatus ATCC 10500]EED22259.1 short-chain dehydrogenases/reductase, putative [Talaromyces stipitatus ATCC 10500]
MAPSKRSILITGCSQGGAGNALALEFAAQGLRVFATARSLNSMSNLSEKGIETLVLDVTVPESILALKEEIVKRTGGTLDILYNNAGSMYEAPALEADRSQVRKMFDANIFGLFDMVTAFTPLLIAAAPDSKTAPTIVNVASILARLPFPFASAYNASKAAVSAYSDTLRVELSPLGIRVVTLFMGEVSTKLRSANNISFGPESLYADVEVKVKERTEQSAKVSMTPDVFAKQVVPKVLANNNANYLWKGTNAFIVWLLAAVGPRKVFDSTVMGPVGFGDKNVIKRIYDRGQRLVEKS